MLYNCNGKLQSANKLDWFELGIWDKEYQAARSCGANDAEACLMARCGIDAHRARIGKPRKNWARDN